MEERKRAGEEQVGGLTYGEEMTWEKQCGT